MPEIARYHPIIVHFVIALAMVGIALRWFSLTGKLPFTRPAAATLLILAGLAGILAAQSGAEAHERVEQIPGVSAQMEAHQDAGEWARDALMVVGAFEILGLLLVKNDRWRRYAEYGSAVVCIAAAGAVYVAGARGGDLVYSYAGGPGLRTGDTVDVHRLLNAGLYEEAMLARRNHRSAMADSLMSQLERFNPTDVNMKLAMAQSLLIDRKDPQAALAMLDSIPVPDSARFLKLRIAFERVNAYTAAGMKDSAKAVMTRLVAAFPNNRRLKERLQRMK